MSKLSMECISERVTNIKDKIEYKKVEMSGFHKDLMAMKCDLENIFDKHFFWLGCSLSDAPYHGWCGESLHNMINIDKDIQQKFYELYAIILKSTDSNIV